MNNDFQQQGTQPPQAAPIPQATPMPTAQQTAVPPSAQFNPNFQNQFGGGGPKPLPKGLLKIIGISVAALLLIVGIIITVLIVTDPGYELDGTVIVEVDKDRKEIVIREGVTGIAKGAFAHCGGLEQITIPASLKNVEPGEFSDCVGLRIIVQHVDKTSNCSFVRNALPSDYNGTWKVIIADGVTRIGNRAFAKFTNLTSVTIPASVTSIEIEAFAGCSGLTSVTIPNSVTSIGYSAFSDCDNLSSVTIPNSVTSIGERAFRNCSNLSSVTIPNSVTSIGASAFWGCSNLSSVTIPNSVTEIGREVFYGCDNLTTITIPNSVTAIGGRAFNHSGLKLAYIPKNCVVSETAFDSNVQLIRLASEDYKTLESAEKGNAEAQYRIGKICSDHKMYDIAVEWYRKSADQGNAYAQYRLGNCYEKGLGVAKDLEKAAEFWKLAVEGLKKVAEQGEPEAQNILGLCYEYGNGVPKDIAKAVEWYRKAAEQGYAAAQCNLGFCYEYGDGVPKDIAKAVEWYRKSADQGYAIAQFNLGVCYKNGEGVPKDFKQAVYWYRKAADQGDAGAQNNLGLCYYNGEGVPKDFKQAVYWWKKAADQGYAIAQFNLGNRYAYGEGVPNDFKQAVYWYRKAADQGLAEAQFNLGFCYENGVGVAKNLVEALKWYRKAADQGKAKAKTRAERIEAELKAEAARKQLRAQLEASGFEASGFEALPLPQGIKLEMVKIPAGSFQRVGLTVTLSKPFWLGKYEVTQAQWKAVMGNNPSRFKGDNLPVEQVSLVDAKKFCIKLNEIYADKLPSGYQFDLPTEAQWEYACRAGTTTDLNNGKNLTSNWEECSNLNEVAWYIKNTRITTSEVGQKRANAWGLYDMHGNVWEWCRDRYGDYPGRAVTDPVGPSFGSNHVIRGGSWYDFADICRSDCRGSRGPLIRSDSGGFRLALVPIQ